MDEDSFRPTVLRALRPLHAVYVENPHRAGTPDINYVHGWLELKWLPSWPRKPETPVRLPEFTPQQRVFLVQRCQAGGRANVLLRVGRTWILLPGMWSALCLDRATRAEIEHASIAAWRPGLDAYALCALLGVNTPRQVLEPFDVKVLLAESAFASSVFDLVRINTKLQSGLEQHAASTKNGRRMLANRGL